MPRPIKYDILADPSGFKRGAQEAQNALQSLGRTAERVDRAVSDINVDIDVDADLSTIQLLRRRLLMAKAELENDIRINPDIDATKAMYQLRSLERRLKELDRMDVSPEVNIDVDRGWGALGVMIKDATVNASRFTAMMSKMPPQAMAAAAAVGAVGAALATPVITGTIGGIFAGTTAFAGFGLLKAFDEVEKATRRAKIVFGANLKEMEAWAEGVSYNVGLGTQDVIKGASAIQDLLVPRGFSRAQAAAITREVYERGAAIAEFSGRETTDGIEAVTKALLGQGKSLTLMGVEIRKNDVKKWIKENADEVAGLNEKQAEVVATLALIKQNSKDAWTQYKEGAGTADELLDTLAATWANLKTTFVQGFGGIFVDLIDDISQVVGGFDGIKGASENLGGWIEKNRDQIRAFMLEIVDLSVQGAIAFLEMGKMLSYVGEWAVKAIPDMMRFSGNMIDLAEKAGAAWALMSTPIGSQEFRDAWKVLSQDTSQRVQEIEASADRMEARLNGWDLSGFRRGLDSGIAGLMDFRDNLDLLRVADDIAVRVTTVLDQQGKAEAKDYIRSLTDEEIEILVRTGVLDDSSLNKFLDKEYDKRINARVELEFNGKFATADEVNREVDRLFSQGRVTEAVALKKKLDATVTFTPDTSKVDTALSGFSAGADVSVNVTAPNLAPVKADLDTLSGDKETQVKVGLTSSYFNTKGLLDDLSNVKPALVRTGLTSSYFNVKGMLDYLARPRTVLYTVQYRTVGKPPGSAQQSVAPGEGYAQQSVAVATTPDVNVYVQDERLTDLIDVEIGGRSQATARRFTRRYGVV